VLRKTRDNSSVYNLIGNAMNRCNIVVLVLFIIIFFSSSLESSEKNIGVNADLMERFQYIPEEGVSEEKPLNEDSEIEYGSGENVTRGGCKKIKKCLEVQEKAVFCKNVTINGDLNVDGIISACNFPNICSLIGMTGPTGPMGSLNASFSGPVTIGSCTGLTGNLTVGGDLEVCSDEFVSGTLSADQAGIFLANVTVDGVATFNSDVTINGDLSAVAGTFTNNVTVDGDFGVGGGFIGCGYNMCCAVTNNAIYAGTALSGTGITFPTGYFATAPAVLATINGSGGECTYVLINNVTEAGFHLGTSEPVSVIVGYVACGAPGTGYCPAV
jgi:hypothetical protein